PPGMFTMGQLIDACVDAANQIAKPTPPPRAVWVDATFLEQQKVAPWSDMPVWLPARDEMAAASQTSANKALEAGLKIRPIGPTVRDTLRWHLERPEAERAKPRAGIAPD